MRFIQLFSQPSLVVLILLCAVPRDLNAVQSLTLTELNTLCEEYSIHPQQNESMQCARYIKGFIDGAVAADAGVRSEQIKDSKEEQSFSQRAIENRIGSRVKSQESEENSVFCLGDPIVLSHVITTVTDEIQKIKDKNSSALGAVYQVLRNQFPCTE